MPAMPGPKTSDLLHRNKRKINHHKASHPQTKTPFSFSSQTLLHPKPFFHKSSPKILLQHIIFLSFFLSSSVYSSQHKSHRRSHVIHPCMISTTPGNRILPKQTTSIHTYLNVIIIITTTTTIIIIFFFFFFCFQGNIYI